MARRSGAPPVPAGIKWAAFLGWLVLPVLAAWATTAALGTGLLWSGPIWVGYAILYMAVYFSWVRRRALSLSARRTGGGRPGGPDPGRR